MVVALNIHLYRIMDLLPLSLLKMRQTAYIQAAVWKFASE